MFIWTPNFAVKRSKGPQQQQQRGSGNDYTTHVKNNQIKSLNIVWFKCLDWCLLRIGLLTVFLVAISSGKINRCIFASDTIISQKIQLTEVVLAREKKHYKSNVENTNWNWKFVQQMVFRDEKYRFHYVRRKIRKFQQNLFKHWLFWMDVSQGNLQIYISDFVECSSVRMHRYGVLVASYQFSNRISYAFA